jgi:hypothetical protein
VAPDPDVIVLDPLASVTLIVTSVDPDFTRTTRMVLPTPAQGITRWTVAVDAHGCKQVTVDRS